MLPFGSRNKIIELIYYYYDRCTGNCLSHSFLVVTLVFLLKGLVGNHICVFIMSPWFYHLQLFLLPSECTSSGGIPVDQSGSLEHLLPDFCENRYQKKVCFTYFISFITVCVKHPLGSKTTIDTILFSLHVLFLPPSLFCPPPMTNLCT